MTYMHWKGLESDGQRPRYEAIAEAVASASTILDVGCGTGVLRSYLEPDVKYLGIDADPTAVAVSGEANVQIATAEEFRCTERYEAAVLNEVLYYCRDPLAILSKYAKFVEPGGVLVVSIFMRRKPVSLKRALTLRRTNMNLWCAELTAEFADKFPRYTVSRIAMPGSGEYWKVWSIETPQLSDLLGGSRPRMTVRAHCA